MPAEQISAGLTAAEIRTQSASDRSAELEPAAATDLEQSESSTLNSETPEPVQEEFVYPAEHHLWARFPIGSWREIEITTETFDASGKIYGRSVTIQKETLKAMADDSYVLETQATVEVSGKQIIGPVNTRILRLITDRSGVVFSSSRQDDEIVQLNDRPYECQVWDVLYGEEAQNLRDRVYYCSEKFPYILRRETFEDGENGSARITPTDTSGVIAEHVPLLVDNQIISCVCSKSTHFREKGSMQSLKMISPQIPGGEVQSWSTDFNAEAEPNRWSVLKLLKFGANPTADDSVQED